MEFQSSLYKLVIIKNRTNTSEGTLINGLTVSSLSYLERINTLSSLEFDIVINGASQLIKETFLKFNSATDIIDIELQRDRKIIGLFELINVKINSKGEGKGTVDNATCYCRNKLSTILAQRFIGENSQQITFQPFSLNIQSISNNVITVDNPSNELDLFVGKTFTNITLEGLTNSNNNGDNVIIDVNTITNTVTVKNNISDQVSVAGQLKFFAFEEDVAWGIVDKLLNDTISAPFTGVVTTDLLQTNGNISLGTLEKTFNQRPRDYATQKIRSGLDSIINLTKTVDRNLFIDQSIQSISGNQVVLTPGTYDVNSPFAELTITGTTSNNGVYTITNIDDATNTVTVNTILTSQGTEGLATAKNIDRVRGFKITPNLRENTNSFVFSYFQELGDEVPVIFGATDILNANIALSQENYASGVIVNGKDSASTSINTSDINILNKFGYRQRVVTLNNESDTDLLEEFGERQLAESIASQSEFSFSLGVNNSKIGQFTAGDIIKVTYGNRDIRGMPLNDFKVDEKFRITEVSIKYNFDKSEESVDVKITKFSGFLPASKDQNIADTFVNLSSRVSNLEDN